MKIPSTAIKTTERRIDTLLKSSSLPNIVIQMILSSFFISGENQDQTHQHSGNTTAKVDTDEYLSSEFRFKNSVHRNFRPVIN